ncbi:amidohydrolase family protein [Kordiimonas laminariae]|uniref:amidohydrolase family protein n=1 Tax=Kordiimonas laminariae TaxID=2917717 RepID=UPI001FF2C329|nr:amidohydrolase family protein [Kordiimonas laminariae]MCK0069662.1 amidohydrolase family protein [Kordiimonas laminariae]
MKYKAIIFTVKICVCLLSFAVRSTAMDEPARKAKDDVLVITNAHVIVGDASDVKQNQAVTISAGRILKIQSMRNFIRTNTEAKILDAQGGYLIPGLIDTHVHTAVGPVALKIEEGIPVPSQAPSHAIADHTMASLLKYGVTAARDPGGKTEITVATKLKQQAGEISGPMLQVAGEVIDTTVFENLTTAVKDIQTIKDEVNRQADAGVDWIKLYNTLPEEMLRAGIEAAHARNLKVTGHLQATTWTDAAELGIDSIVHIIPASAELLPAAKRDEYHDASMKTTSILKWFELADFNSPAIKQMIDTLKQNNVSIDLTLVFFHAMTYGDDDRYIKNPALSDAGTELVDNWTNFLMQTLAGPQRILTMHRAFGRGCKSLQSCFLIVV